jgi:hypothetical protein
LHNHSAFGVFGVAAVMTARLTTIRNEQGDAELVSCVLRVPASRDSAIDNMKAGGFIMPIDAQTGVTGLARRGYRGGIVERHPVSGHAFAGFRLPDWVAAKALAKQAHETAFATYRLIGWDVAFTPEGPVLVEGNAKPGVMMPQRAAGRGLAGQRYGELLAWNLAQAEQEMR